MKINYVRAAHDYALSLQRLNVPLHAPLPVQICGLIIISKLRSFYNKMYLFLGDRVRFVIKYTKSLNELANIRFLRVSISRHQFL